MRQTLSDIDTVYEIISDPDCYNSASEDTSLSPYKVALSILKDPSRILLKPDEGTLFLFRKFSGIVYEMHVMILKQHRKQGAKNAFKAAEWVFDNTDCNKLMTCIPSYHELALMFAKVCGLVQEGSLKDATSKDGKLYDLIILGATEKEYKERKEIWHS